MQNKLQLEYSEFKKSLPGDSLDPIWLKMTVDWYKKMGLRYSVERNWIALENLKFAMGYPDPKYAYQMKEHMTIFSIESVSQIAQLSGDSRNEMHFFQEAMVDAGFYVYWNAKVTRSVKRLHYHIITWDTDPEGKKVIVKPELRPHITLDLQL